MSTSSMMRCAWCKKTLAYVHGHAACLDGRCPMFGRNQDDCCSGETAGASCPASGRPAVSGPSRRR